MVNINAGQQQHFGGRGEEGRAQNWIMGRGGGKDDSRGFID